MTDAIYSGAAARPPASIKTLLAEQKRELSKLGFFGRTLYAITGNLPQSLQPINRELAGQVLAQLQADHELTPQQAAQAFRTVRNDLRQRNNQYDFKQATPITKRQVADMHQAARALLAEERRETRHDQTRPFLPNGAAFRDLAREARVDTARMTKRHQELYARILNDAGPELPNGAARTTALRVLTNIAKMDSKTVATVHREVIARQEAEKDFALCIGRKNPGSSTLVRGLASFHHGMVEKSDPLTADLSLEERTQIAARKAAFSLTPQQALKLYTTATAPEGGGSALIAATATPDAQALRHTTLTMLRQLAERAGVVPGPILSADASQSEQSIQEQPPLPKRFKRMPELMGRLMAAMRTRDAAVAIRQAAVPQAAPESQESVAANQAGAGGANGEHALPVASGAASSQPVPEASVLARERLEAVCRDVDAFIEENPESILNALAEFSPCGVVVEGARTRVLGSFGNALAAALAASPEMVLFLDETHDHSTLVDVFLQDRPEQVRAFFSPEALADAWHADDPESAALMLLEIGDTAQRMPGGNEAVSFFCHEVTRSLLQHVDFDVARLETLTVPASFREAAEDAQDIMGEAAGAIRTCAELQHYSRPSEGPPISTPTLQPAAAAPAFRATETAASKSVTFNTTEQVAVFEQIGSKAEKTLHFVPQAAYHETRQVDFAPKRSTGAPRESKLLNEKEIPLYKDNILSKFNELNAKLGLDHVEEYFTINNFLVEDILSEIPQLALAKDLNTHLPAISALIKAEMNDWAETSNNLARSLVSPGAVSGIDDIRSVAQDIITYRKKDILALVAQRSVETDAAGASAQQPPQADHGNLSAHEMRTAIAASALHFLQERERLSQLFQSALRLDAIPTVPDEAIPVIVRQLGKYTAGLEKKAPEKLRNLFQDGETLATTIHTVIRLTSAPLRAMLGLPSGARPGDAQRQVTPTASAPPAAPSASNMQLPRFDTMYAQSVQARPDSTAYATAFSTTSSPDATSSQGTIAVEGPPLARQSPPLSANAAPADPEQKTAGAERPVDPSRERAKAALQIQTKWRKNRAMIAKRYVDQGGGLVITQYKPNARPSPTASGAEINQRGMVNFHIRDRVHDSLDADSHVQTRRFTTLSAFPEIKSGDLLGEGGLNRVSRGPRSSIVRESKGTNTSAATEPPRVPYDAYADLDRFVPTIPVQDDFEVGRKVGIDLVQHLEQTRRPLPLAAFEEPSRQLCELNARELFHRDIKVENMTITTGSQGRMSLYFIDTDGMISQPPAAPLPPEFSHSPFLRTNAIRDPNQPNRIVYTTNEAVVSDNKADDEYAFLLTVITMTHGTSLDANAFNALQDTTLGATRSNEVKAIHDGFILRAIKPQYRQQVSDFLEKPWINVLTEPLHDMIAWR